jgi:hypothetical protein
MCENKFSASDKSTSELIGGGDVEYQQILHIVVLFFDQGDIDSSQIEKTSVISNEQTFLIIKHNLCRRISMIRSVNAGYRTNIDA